jgi:hypothetical protein
MKKSLSILTILFTLFVGCATIDRGSEQRYVVYSNNDVAQADTRCTLKNDDNEWTVSVNQTIKIDRDGDPLDIECQNDKQVGSKIVEAKFSSEYLLQNALMWDLCTISCLIDASTGAFYEYPIVRVDMKSKGSFQQ